MPTIDEHHANDGDLITTTCYKTMGRRIALIIYMLLNGLLKSLAIVASVRRQDRCIYLKVPVKIEMF